jgi:hypothetical protein
MSKLGGGLKSGIKQQDMTRRLDDNLSSSNFERARKPTKLRKHVKSLTEHLVYVFIGLALFFCAVRFTVQTWFPDKIHKVLAPILGKNAAVVEQTLTGEPATELEDPDKPAKGSTTDKPKQSDKSAKTSHKKKHHSHH